MLGIRRLLSFLITGRKVVPSSYRDLRLCNFEYTHRPVELGVSEVLLPGFQMLVWRLVPSMPPTLLPREVLAQGVVTVRHGSTNRVVFSAPLWTLDSVLWGCPPSLTQRVRIWISDLVYRSQSRSWNDRLPLSGVIIPTDGSSLVIPFNLRPGVPICVDVEPAEIKKLLPVGFKFWLEGIQNSPVG